MHIAYSTYLVRDYDEAIAYFTDVMGFALSEDTDMSKTPDDNSGKRWVVVMPDNGNGQSSGLLLAKAKGDEQISAIGKAAGGRVAYFLHVKDFDRYYANLTKHDVKFMGEPRIEPYGKVVVFEDLYGNKWDLIGALS